jgi:RNA polymerase sigma-70 factor (ECF subfamily)
VTSGRRGDGDGGTDAQLARAAGSGDGRALEMLFRRHHARVHALCARLLDSADAADDAVQETFLRVARYGRRFEARASFTTWLYRIARNACHDLRAASARAERREAAWVAERDTARELPPLADDRLRMLDTALARLPPEAREVLVLARHLDLTADDMARVLGCTPGAARVRVHRALARLREICTEMERDPWTANAPSKR